MSNICDASSCQANIQASGICKAPGKAYSIKQKNYPANANGIKKAVENTIGTLNTNCDINDISGTLQLAIVIDSKGKAVVDTDTKGLKGDRDMIDEFTSRVKDTMDQFKFNGKSEEKYTIKLSI